MAQITPQLSRAVHLLLAGVIALAFVGFIVGLRQGKTVPDIAPPPRDEAAAHPHAIPATAWRDYDRRLYGPNREWQNTLANLRPPAVEPAKWAAASAAERQSLQAARADRRAFPGAPPVVPHPIDQMATASCVACHGEGLAIGKGVVAPKMSHALLPNCTQCHVELAAADLANPKTATNTFEPVAAAPVGARAWQGAPPVIPHTTWMRENCLSCHGPSGPRAIQTSHPERVSCRQCHAPSAVLDQVFPDDHPAWLGAADLPPRSDAP